MKVLFLQPPLGSWVTWGNHKAINVSHAQMAACVREWTNGIEVKAIDCAALNMDHKAMLAAVTEIDPDLVYMGDAYQMTETLAIVPHYQKAGTIIKDAIPNVKICTGGFYIACNYKDVFAESPQFDFVLAGEPELTFVELCKELQKSDPDIPSVKGVCHRVNGEEVINDYRPLIENLDELPMPAYDLFPMDAYIGYGRIKNFQQIFTSRGCPFGCDFCIDWVTMDPRGKRDWQKHRIKSASKVVDELELLKKTYGIDYVQIFDLNFSPKRRRVEEFASEMLHRDFDMKYAFLGNAHTFVRDFDLLGDLHRSGFVAGIYGLEVADDEDLKNMHKGTTVEEVKEVTRRFREHGILSVITWIIGFPDDSLRLIKERFAALDDIDPDVMALQMLLPVPGLPITENLQEYIEEPDYLKWDFHHPIVRTKHLTREKLGKLAEWANREFYSSKGRIQRVLESDTLNNYAVEIFRSYMENMDAYAKSAASGE